MYANKLLSVGLVLPVLAVGLMLGAPQPAQAGDDLAWLLGGVALGAILSNGHHYGYYEPPVVGETYYYPEAQVLAAV